MAAESSRGLPAAKIVVATTVALTFISFWRAAAIVLSDLASTMFYVGGIAEQAVGKPAPWLVLLVMLFAFAVRWVYLESCSMFVRGGVYVVVRDSMGPFLAKLSVSALVVDYVLTGPISSVSAGQYLAGLINEVGQMTHVGFRVAPHPFAAAFGVAVTLYFWWANVRGIRESSSKALRIMQITTVMVVVLLVWCLITLLVRGGVELPPAPTPANFRFTEESLGWFHGTSWPRIALVAFLIAFGHSLLAMSGFETLAQVYREIAHPKLKNLKITANIVCTYALIATGLSSLFAVMLIPDSVRPRYYDNLLGGLSMELAGPLPLRLMFHVFVVLVGVLILSGAVNTSIIGANGVLNRVAEDGVLTEWFRKPHRRFGTSHHIINAVTLLQILTILGSRGDVYLLGEAYAFGVIWSFAFKALGVMALRFQRADQEYKAPWNLRLGGREWPLGLGLVTLTLFAVAVTNLFSKRIATIFGVSLTTVLFAVFLISERWNARKRQQKKSGLEEFNLELQPQVSTATVRARPGCVLVAIRDYNRMHHLARVLEKTNVRRHDIVVMTVRPVSGTGEYDLAEHQLFTDYEQELFTRVVSVAEKQGKPVELLVVPGVDPFDAMVQTAANLQASRLVTGVSARMASEELARLIGLAWERLPEPRHAFSLEIISPDRPSMFVNLGPHPPRLWPEDVERLHELWLRLTEEPGIGARLHHRDVVGVALRRLERDLANEKRQEVIEEIRRELSKG
ncbi:MAG: APC family permease [Bryobacterales bacterium]|nr:APC family permease [Bryobacteraceae bacterium]MDW8353700.1 APC family permease [Bryobacterales bacterium]